MDFDRIKTALGITSRVAERRADARRKVLLKAEAYKVEAYTKVSVKNVSRTGLMAESPAGLQALQTIAFSIDGRTYQLATVRWARGRRFGLELDKASSILGIEGLEAEDAANLQPRAKRYEVDTEGQIALLSHPRPVTVRDVSQSGLQIEGRLPFAVGQEILLKLPDNSPIIGTVRWNAKGRFGVIATERMATLRLAYSYE